MYTLITQKFVKIFNIIDLHICTTGIHKQEEEQSKRVTTIITFPV